MSKVLVHIPDSYNGLVPPQSHHTLCYKMIGDTDGFIDAVDILKPLMGSWKKKVYNLSLTKKGIEKLNYLLKDFATPSKFHGYYQEYHDQDKFLICKYCLDSEEFGMLALKEL